jgi:hypothetical protein
MSNTDLAGSLGDYMPRGLMEWAPVLGAGTAASGTVLARVMAPAGSWFSRNAEMSGVLLSSAVAAALAAMPGTRPAALMTFLGGVAAGLPRILERYALGGGVSGIGYYAAETANPLLGMVRADQLGYATAGRQPHAYGTVPGVAGGALAGPMADSGNGPPVNLLGHGHGDHMSMASRFGATHMSR